LAAELPGSDKAFFFRKDELSYLQNRMNYPGVTLICGRPRSGKSWLLGKLLRQIQSDSKILIGFTRCSAQDSDSLMRVVDDLYTRWRERATLLDQAKEFFDNTRGQWPQVISNVVGKIVS
jgi:hypothetical protein